MGALGVEQPARANGPRHSHAIPGLAVLIGSEDLPARALEGLGNRFALSVLFENGCRLSQKRDDRLIVCVSLTRLREGDDVGAHAFALPASRSASAARDATKSSSGTLSCVEMLARTRSRAAKPASVVAGVT